MKFIPYASSSAGNMYEVQDEQTRILIECGLPIKEMQRLTGHTLSQFDGCVVSHSHKDHCKGIFDIARMGINLLCEFDSDDMDGKTYSRGSFDIMPFAVSHDVVNYGFAFKSGVDNETLVFLIDTFYCPVVFDFSPTIFAIECNYAKDLLRDRDSINDRLYSSHMSLEQCIATLKANDLRCTREIHLLHLSDSRSDEQRFINEVQKATGVPTYAAPKLRTI